MIAQLEPQIPVDTPHGPGLALLVIDYGQQWNTVWVVALHDSLAIKHYESEQIRLSPNFTFGYGPSPN